MKIRWKGKGLLEKCIYKKKIIIEIDKKYFRPIEVSSLMGNAAKARKKLGWKPKYNIHKLIDDIIKNND